MKTNNYKRCAAAGVAAFLMTGIALGQTVTGFGSYQTLAKWSTNPTGSTLTTSQVKDDGTNVGIGLTPAYKLDVNGSINITSTSAYKIGGNNVLWHNGNTSDLFVGVSAGNATMTGHANILMGKSAGVAMTSGVKNTFIGFEAGFSNTTGDSNVVVGYQAFHSNTIAYYNTAIGYQALYSYSRSDSPNSTNTACGFQALYSTQRYGGAAFGFWAAKSNTLGCGSDAFGEEALRDNTTGNYNVAIGTAACHLNVTGSYNTCVGDNAGAGVATTSHNNNSFFGAYAGKAITTGGDNNAFVGYCAGYTTSSGNVNCFMGDSAGYLNSTGHNNVYVGHITGYSGSTASNNTFTGDRAGTNTTTGNGNTATGMYSLPNNSIGELNAAAGYQALYGNTTGTGNTGMGVNSGFVNSTGTYNTYLGYSANTNGNYTNSGAIGNSAVVTASDKIYMGNSSLLGVYDATGVFTTSDGRFKKNVNEDVKGLEFINKLRPVTYNLDTKALDDFLIRNMPDDAKAQHKKGLDFTTSTAVVHSGFIAQEVEQAEKQAGFSSSIVSAPKNDSDPYALSYAEIVVPLVKAVQQLSKTTDDLKTKLVQQDSVNTVLQKQVTALTHAQNNTAVNAVPASDGTAAAAHATTSIDVNLKEEQSVVLDQNVPNPFAEQTVINYFLPDNTGKAEMLFYNSSGNLIKSVELQQKGKGQLNVFANDLTNGIYTYTLIIDGKVFDTKKMVRQ